MAYQKKEWKDLPLEETPLDAEGLNDQEDRISDAIDPLYTKTKNLPADGSFDPLVIDEINEKLKYMPVEPPFNPYGVPHLERAKIGDWFYTKYNDGTVELYAIVTLEFHNNIALQKTLSLPFRVEEFYTSQVSKSAGFFGRKWQRSSVGITTQIPDQSAVIRSFSQEGDSWITGDKQEVYAYIVGRYK